MERIRPTTRTRGPQEDLFSISTSCSKSSGISAPVQDEEPDRIQLHAMQGRTNRRGQASHRDVIDWPKNEPEEPIFSFSWPLPNASRNWNARRLSRTPGP